MNKLFADLMEKQSPTPAPQPETQTQSQASTSPADASGKRPIQRNPDNKGKKTSSDASIPRYRDTTLPANRDTLIEAIRKAVHQLGKEAATYRFTQEEKRALADIVYTYKARGIRTSENELTRIAIHSLIEEYRETGEASVLARVLERLNA